MNSSTGLNHHAAAWLADGPTELSDRVLDAALREVHLTKQRHAARVPWRFPNMPALSRATGIAAVALAAMVGAGGLMYLTSRAPGDTGGGSTSAPTIAPTPRPSPETPGITGWTTYHSKVYGFDFGYPNDWTVESSATREWQAGDTFGPEGPSAAAAETLFTLVDDGVLMFVWRMPVAANADVSTLEGLKAWAEVSCNEAAFSDSCDDLNDRALPMCLGQVACGPALLVPNEIWQVAFIAHPSLERVTVVAIPRPDTHSSVLRYRGSVQLLKSILTRMDVSTPEPGQTPG